ncbi:pentapeptide repeat-containing protein [Haloarculaceae archaeon H-GB1-1]|nr:pentapeptide repeat-containing protein [Haloarculaceae archaeon H-GB1-1]
MSDADQERCDYRLTVGQVHDDIEAEPCERPVWEDHDRCFWHAPVEEKTSKMLDEAEVGNGDDLDGAYLREAVFATEDLFRGRSLIGADFAGADVKGTDFSEADLTLANMSDVSAINADFEGANLEGAILTNADLRQATLTDARLHETILTDMHIGGGTTIGDVNVYDRENAPPDIVEDQPLDAAAWVYRQLQTLYQSNGLAELARQSYFMEKDTRRRLAWEKQRYTSALKQELSRWVMRYGESPYRVLLTSLFVIVLFAVMFPLTGGIQEGRDGQDITYVIQNPEVAPMWWVGRVLFKSLYFSVVTFATLGYGDIQPIGPWARFLAGIESLLGALLAALLVFVLARIVTW